MTGAAPCANGQGRTKDECLKSLSQAINLILEDRREDGFRGIPEDASREVVFVEWLRVHSPRLAACRHCGESRNPELTENTGFPRIGPVLAEAGIRGRLFVALRLHGMTIIVITTQSPSPA